MHCVARGRFLAETLQDEARALIARSFIVAPDLPSNDLINWGNASDSDEIKAVTAWQEVVSALHYQRYRQWLLRTLFVYIPLVLLSVALVLVSILLTLPWLVPLVNSLLPWSFGPRLALRTSWSDGTLKVMLRNVELSNQALALLNTKGVLAEPMHLSQVMVGCLRIEIPMAYRSRPVLVALEQVDLGVRLQDEKEWDMDKLKAHASKALALLVEETTTYLASLHLPASNFAVPAASYSAGALISDNLRLELSSVAVHIDSPNCTCSLILNVGKLAMRCAEADALRAESAAHCRRRPVMSASSDYSLRLQHCQPRR